MNIQEKINLARQRHQEGDIAAAEKLFREVVQEDPNNAEGHSRLGRLLHELGRLDDAIVELRQAAALWPHMPAAAFNLGVALDQKGEFRQAAACYQHVLTLRPDDHQALTNLGVDQCRVGQWDQAIATLQVALRIAPTAPQAHLNLGNAFLGMGDNDRGIEAFNRALALAPRSADAWNNLANAYIGTGQPAKAVESYQKVLELAPGVVQVESNLLYALYLDPAQDPFSILRKHLEFGERHGEALKSQIHIHENDRSPDRPLRIGYVSADLYNCLPGRMILPLVREHEREQYAVYCYNNSAIVDAFTEVIRPLASGWRNIRDLSDERAAELIREDQIDILVDLSQHTPGNRLMLLARKPAPVQASAFNYAGTTGLWAIDGRLSDPYVDPEGQHDSDYSEQTYRLPETLWCYDVQAMQWEPGSAGGQPFAEPGGLPAETAGHVTFGYLGDFSRVNERVVRLWADLLNAAPKLRLLLAAPVGETRRRITETFGDRIEILEPLGRRASMAMYSRIDVALDPFPFSAHISSLDAMWMGVPVITRNGSTAPGRAVASALANLGLTELIAGDDTLYLQIAAALAADLPRLGALRRELRKKMQSNPLCDAVRWVRNVEAAYRALWKRQS